MTPKRPVYPFAALVGQERLKLALILNAVNPRIGGVLIRGEKGTAKSTAARGLAELLPPIAMVAGCPFHCHPDVPELMCDACRQRHDQGEALPRRDRPMVVVDLPLGTTEDRLLGTIDLEVAIKSGEKHFEPGLLASANRGILYVDEVNLLDDHLVDVLLDAAAMGVNVVEREGISFAHPARFILVGTMNPEEGELRPQLLDRFGLCVEVTGLNNLDARMAVVERRLAFEADPEGFAAGWQGEQEIIRQSILNARERLPRVSFSQDLLRLITAICVDQGVDGHRADIFMLKVAQTLAAYRGREAVSRGRAGGRRPGAAPPPAPPTLQRIRDGRKPAGGNLPEARRGDGVAPRRATPAPAGGRRPRRRRRGFGRRGHGGAGGHLPGAAFGVAPGPPGQKGPGGPHPGPER